MTREEELAQLRAKRKASVGKGGLAERVKEIDRRIAELEAGE